MNKNLLQRILMPEAKDRDYSELFMRSEVVECNAFGKSLNVLRERYFNTWMNVFAAKKWFHYAELSNLYLCLDVSGTYCIEVIGSNRNMAYNRIDERLFFKEYVDQNCPVSISIQNPADYDAVYFILRDQKDQPCDIKSMGWYTDSKPKKKNCLAIVTCTYKREDYIRNTINLFKDYMDSNIELQDRMHLFVVDNGQTLEGCLENQYTNIYSNINAGGAGGFGRGLIEVCKSDKEYTRCLFMDDDVEIIPESFYRTLVLVDYLKDSYQDALINGTMLDIYNKSIFYENLSVQNGIWCNPYHGEGNLSFYDEILRVNEISDEVYYKDYPKVHGGWFYCSFPVNKSYINKLPMPFFIRGDDVEYGYRNHGKVFIQLNGICIWHAPFYYRVNKITDIYYMFRNMFIVNTLYTKGFKQKFKALYCEKFHYAIETYDYVSVRLLIKAIEDILKGSRIFNENPVEIMHLLQEMAKEPEDCVSDPYELYAIRDKRFEWSKLRCVLNRILPVCYKWMPCLKCIIKRNKMNTAPEWFPPEDAFLLHKQVKVYNLLKHTSITRKFDFHKERTLTREFRKKIKELEDRYDILEEDYSSNFARLTSYDFWRDYLSLD